MIRSFANKETEKIFNRERSRRLPSDIQQTALRKLRMLNNVANLDDLRAPPGHRLEKLSDRRAGQPSLQINDQGRICFEWRGSEAHKLRLWITTKARSRISMIAKLHPVHPGEVLLEEFLKPSEISQNRLALEIGVDSYPFHRHAKRDTGVDRAD